MKVEQKGHTTIIRDTQGDLTAFLMKLTHEYKSFSKHNLIIDLTDKQDATIREINAFLPLSKEHSKAKKSFVIVISDFDYNKVSDKLIIVPTRLEAHDMIEMDEIERDLGF